MFNIKQKIKEKTTVTIDEFEKLTDISSISGSDSEGESNYSSSEEENSLPQIHKNPKLAFELNDGNFLVVHRCLLQRKKEFLKNEQLIANIQNISDTDSWAVILVAGGHFAAAIFKGYNIIYYLYNFYLYFIFK